MESTGDYWQPVFNMREGMVAVLLVHAQHVKAVPGRKTDGTDAAGRAELLPQGLWRASVMSPGAQRERRDLTRYRSTFIHERVTLIHRVQPLLEEAHSQLAAVAADIIGVSGRVILAARRIGHADPQARADLAQGRWRSPREQWTKAWEGRVKPHQRVVLTARCSQIDRLDETSARFDTRIQEICGPFEEAVGRLDTIPGGARHTAAMLVADMGPDLTRLPRADHLASWAGVAPGNDDSAGPRASGKTRTGNRCLRTSLVQAAHAAARTTGTDRSAPYRRLATRRGKKRAMLAVAHSILVMADEMIQRQEPDHDAGADCCDRLQPEATARRLINRVEQLGYQVTLQGNSSDAIPC